MATNLLLTSTLLYHPSTLKSSPFFKPSKPHNFPISISQEHKFHKQRNISVIVCKYEPDPKEDDEYDVGVRAALSILKFYKGEISPLLPKSCRYVPTCSEYSMIAYKKYGAVKGSVLTAWRICRCNPLGGSGFDPPRWFGEERPPEE